MPSNDIMDYTSHSVSKLDKYYILRNHWKPPANFSFPVTMLNDKKRKFQRQWLDSHSWLVYSPTVDGGFCKFCVLFCQFDNANKFVKTPCKNWTKALVEIQQHSSLTYHQDAVAKAENFLESMEKPSSNIVCQMDAELLKPIETNRQILTSVVKIVVLCGRQGLALRGNNDDGVLQKDNMSNFNALLELRIDAGDEILKRHLQTCSANATYVSKTTQNRLINLIGQQIRDKILAEVKTAGHFALLADEATDAGNWEQLALVLRFVDNDNTIREEFLSFLQCESITGEALTEKILQCLGDWNLDPNDIRGQGYDGAANMAGKFRGVKARILSINKKALYFHCAAHCLNLCVVKSCQVPQLRNMLGTLQEVASFFNFAPKRQRKLEEVLSAAMPENKKEKLVDLCKTRWVERHAAFETFAEIYLAVHDCLGQITEDRTGWDSDTLTRAAGLLTVLQTGDFLVAFVVARKCLQYLKPLTVNLQKRAKDIVAAYSEIADVTRCISDLRVSVDDSFSTWFAEANVMSRAMTQDDIQMPRNVGRQVHHDNHPATTTEEFFRRTVAIPFLDHLSRELQDRFQNADVAKDGLQLVPVNVVQAPRGFRKVPEGVRCLCDLWESDLPDINSVEAEFNRWCAKWQRKNEEGEEIPATATKALSQCPKEFYPNLHALLRLICTLPITTAECERSVSRLRMLKTYLRSSMGEDRLNGLALMRLHRNLTIDIPAIVDAFALKYRTHMSFLPQKLLIM